MKKNTFLSKAFTALAFLAIFSASFAQTPVVVPNDIKPGDYASYSVEGWRMYSTGNSTEQLVKVSDFGIPANHGPHSIRTSRAGGAGLNRSWLGYYQGNQTLASLDRFSWYRYTENGTDTYLNIFLTNGSSLATVVYIPKVTAGIWEESVFNSNISGNLYIRLYNNSNTSMTPITYAQLINQFGDWTIYNQPEGYLSNFTGGIVIVSGSSSPTAAQTHTFDKVTVRFVGQEGKTFDFVSGEVVPPPASPCSASEVVLYAPAKQKDGSDIPEAFADPSKALKEPENLDNSPTINAVTLGFGGTLVLKMSSPIKNGPGNDFRVVETSGGLTSTICQRHPERVMAFASQDGCNWVYAGSGCQDIDLDLGDLNWASYIKLIDVSPIEGIYQGEPIPNGYDVDGVICLNGSEENPIMQDLGALYAVDYSDFNQGLRKNGTPVPADRSMPAQIMGKPENNNTVNFVALGFGGTIVLELGYVVFDKPGNDIQIVETSFGNPSCTSYPEKASVEVSLDKSNWVTLGATLCQDGKIDFGFAGIKAVKYLRVTDRTLASKFSGTADAYDIDGVVVLQPGCEMSPNAIPEVASRNDDEKLMTLIAGSVNNEFLINGPEEIISAGFKYKVANLAGQLMLEGQIQGQTEENTLPAIQLSGIQSGIYFITFQSENHTETIKLLKR